MASSVIGALRANLGLDSAQFESGARRVQAPLARMRTQFLAFAAVAAAAGAALAGLAARGAADIDKTAKSARRLGASIGGFRAMELAAEEAGVSLSTLVDGVQTMDREVARGAKNAVGALGQLGIAVADLDGLDADEKLALIADRVKELGLTSGQATALLQDLGIRNREMVLALLGGGDAFRQARKDVADYGLALSEVDASRIEAANDAIGRLSLIGKYLAQQISLLLTPALGDMAKAMTDSLREGGRLRAMIDGFVGSVGFISRAFVSFGVFMGGRYVVALVAARIATFNLAVALTTLRGALIRTGIGALVVLAGELVYWMVEASRKVGGVGTAFSLMWGVASEVVQRIGMGFQWVGTMAELAGAKIEEYFLRAFGKVIGAFVQMTWAIADGMNSLFGTNVQGADATATQDAHNAIVAAEGRSAGLAGAAADLKAGIGAPLQSLQALRDAMRETEEETLDASDGLEELNDALEETGGSGGGGGGKAGAAAAAIDKVKDSAEALAERSRTGAQAISDLFISIVDGTKKPMQALADLLKRIGEVMVQNALLEIAGTGGGGIFGWLGGLLGANANGTNNWRGGLTAVNERGGEIMNLPRGTQIIPHDISKRMADSAGAGKMEISVNVSGARGNAEIQEMVASGVMQGLSLYDRNLPAKVKAINSDPRAR